MQENKNVFQDHVDFLDSVRGLAAFNVFLSHFFGSFGSPPFLPLWIWFPPISWIGDGYASVSVFFVLSGLVLILGYFFPRRKKFDLGTMLLPYAVSRVLRIGVPFCAMVLATYAACHYFPLHDTSEIVQSSDWSQNLLPDKPTFQEAVRQFLLPFPSLEKHFLPQDWTLSLELHASMLIPFLLLVLLESGVAAVFLVGVLMMLIKAWYVMHFFLGMLVAQNFVYLYRTGQDWKKGWKWALLLLSVPLFSNQTLMKHFSERNAWRLNSIGALILILLLITSPRLQRWMSKPSLLFLGRISYSLYLVHFAVLLLLAPRVVLWLEKAGIENEKWLYGGTLLLTVVFVIFLSALFFYAVEKPTIRLARFSKKKIGEWQKKLPAITLPEA